MKRIHVSGQSTVEYVVVLLLAVIVLVSGDPSPLERIFDAIKEAYERFTHAMSMP